MQMNTWCTKMYCKCSKKGCFFVYNLWHSISNS